MLNVRFVIIVFRDFKINFIENKYSKFCLNVFFNFLEFFFIRLKVMSFYIFICFYVFYILI